MTKWRHVQHRQDLMLDHNTRAEHGTERISMGVPLVNVDQHTPTNLLKTHPKLKESLGTIVLLGVVVVNVTHFAMIPLGVPLGVMIIMKRKMVENDSRLRIQAAGHVMGRTSKDAVYSSNRPMQ